MQSNKTCSCCGRTLPRVSPEGTLCKKCQELEDLNEHFYWLQAVKLISDNLANPLNRFKFQYMTVDEKNYVINRFFEERILKFTI